jgi:hypothetical protein
VDNEDSRRRRMNGCTARYPLRVDYVCRIITNTSLFSQSYGRCTLFIYLTNVSRVHLTYRVQIVGKRCKILNVSIVWSVYSRYLIVSLGQKKLEMETRLIVVI